MTGLTLHPVTLRDARRFIAVHHRHSAPPRGWIVGVGLVDHEGGLVGVGILARPAARGLEDGTTAEITRVCTLGHRNACSMLYGALCRVAQSLGYERVVTYTRDDEAGTSLRASGFTITATVDGARTWNTPARPRAELDLFGQEARDQVPRVRWERTVA